MPYDPTNPSDTSFVSVFPANERAQRLGTQTAFTHEHVIRSDDTAQHKIGHGANAVRDGAPYDPWTSEAAGIALFSKSDTPEMESDMMYLVPGTGGGTPTWRSYFLDVLMARHNAWVEAQTSQWIAATGGPANCTMNFKTANFWRFSATADFTIPNPTALPTRPATFPGACYFLEVTQGSAGDHDILAWGANYVFPGGLAPTALTNGINSIDLIQMILRSDGLIHVEIIRDSQ